MAGLVRRLREADKKIETLALLDVYGRVARVLLDMSEKVGEERMIRSRLPRQEIAKMIGASREMVSRVNEGSGNRGLHRAAARRQGAAARETQQLSGLNDRPHTTETPGGFVPSPVKAV